MHAPSHPGRLGTQMRMVGGQKVGLGCELRERERESVDKKGKFLEGK